MQFGRIPSTGLMVPVAATSAAASETAGGANEESRSGEPLVRTHLHRPAQMNLQFFPAKSLRIRGDVPRLSFAQTCQIVADGRLLTRPSQFAKSFAFRDAFALPNGVFLDVFDGAPDPYYAGTVEGRYRVHDSSFDWEFAALGDEPQIGRNESIMFDPRTHPRGFKAVTFKLQSNGIGRGLPDDSRWFEGVLWEWSITWEQHRDSGRGIATVTTINVPAPTLDMRAAFERYCAVTGRRP